MIRFTAAAMAGLITVALFSAPAYAQSPDQKSMTVTIADLNLASVEGQKTLKTRIRSAARNVCSQSVTGTRLTQAIGYEQCFAAAMSSATAASEPKIAAALARQTKIAAR